MSTAKKIALLCVALICTCVMSAATAQAPASAPKAPPATGTPAVDEEELFDEKLRELGYWAGAAYGCVTEAKQVEVERKVLDTANNIGRLFGTDRAFFFAAAFGRGTTIKIDPAKCPEFLDKFDKATALRGGR